MAAIFGEKVPLACNFLRACWHLHRGAGGRAHLRLVCCALMSAFLRHHLTRAAPTSLNTCWWDLNAAEAVRSTEPRPKHWEVKS